MNILAIGAHPDDIEIGCGGSLIRAGREGHNIFMYVISRGEAGGDSKQRTEELHRAARYLHVKKLWVDNFPDSKIVSNSELIYHIEWVISECNPSLILTHSKHDIHHDHRAVYISSIEAARRIPNILAYENPLSKQFNPQIYVDISEVIDNKISLIRCFRSQKNKDYTSRKAIKVLAEYRAMQSRNNQFISHVEAFEVIKLTFDGDFLLLKTTNTASIRRKMKHDISTIFDMSLGKEIENFELA